MFSAEDYRTLHSLVFQPDYPGYKPNVVESPNGDGKLDTLKKYAHVAEKYLAQDTHQYRPEVLGGFLDNAHELALDMAIHLGIPPAFWPDKRYGALRVLEYGPDAVTNPHKDFDLFTLMMYRNIPEHFKYVSDHNEGGYSAQGSAKRARALRAAQALNAQVHFGELMEEIDSSVDKVWQATKHEVVASGGATQYSCVYFAIPDHLAVIRGNLTVGKWLEERLSRSRYEAK